MLTGETCKNRQIEKRMFRTMRRCGINGRTCGDRDRCALTDGELLNIAQDALSEVASRHGGGALNMEMIYREVGLVAPAKEDAKCVGAQFGG